MKYKYLKRHLKKCIAQAKRKAWEELCNKLEEDAFGDAYKIVKDQMRASSPKISIPLKDKLKAFESLFIAPQTDSIAHRPKKNNLQKTWILM
jgi:hypothetical protein